MTGDFVNAGLNCSIGIPGCPRVEKCNRSVFFLFYSKFDVWVDGIEMVVEFCKVFSGEEQLRPAFTGKPHILTSTFTSTLTTLHNTNARLLEPFSTEQGGRQAEDDKLSN